MHEEVALVGELQPAREVAARPTHAFGNGIHLAALTRKQREDAVGFTELPSAQNHAARLIGARLRQSPRTVGAA
jgi:hypothetical protein